MKPLLSTTHRPNGRIRGTFVYLVLCEERGIIFVKVGIADEPIKRLRAIATGCPLDVGVLAYVELPNRAAAFQAERELHIQFQQWRTRGEWFRFKKKDKKPFNTRLRMVLAHWERPSWQMKWTKLDAVALLRQITAKRLLLDAKKARAQMSRAIASELSTRPEFFPPGLGQTPISKLLGQRNRS